MTTWEIIITSVGSSILGSGAITGFLTYWFQKKIEHDFNEKIETHRIKLEHESEMAIVKLNAQLQISNVRFSHIFEQRAEVILTIYKKLFPLREATYKYIEVAHEPITEGCARSQAIKVLNDLREDFQKFYILNSIFLLEDTAKLVHKFGAKLDELYRNTNVLQTTLRSGNSSKHTEETILRVGNKIDSVEVEVNDLLHALVVEFQNILGIQKESSEPCVPATH